jgi:hypothetical protein
MTIFLSKKNNIYIYIYETNNLFKLIGIDLLFENTTVPNVGGISLNNFERLNGWDAKTR